MQTGSINSQPKISVFSTASLRTNRFAFSKPQNKPKDRADAEQIKFSDWLPKVTPNWVWNWPHQLEIYKALRKVTDGTCKRLMIFMPPRHTKTETVTVRYSAYR